MDLIEHNRQAWNRMSDEGSPWGIPVDAQAIERARHGEWEVQLAGREPVPKHWFGGDIRGQNMLCLAAGGGQQAPILAAAGAQVTALELSDSMLAKDRALADQHGLDLRTEQGSMTDLSRFSAASFDVVFLPVAIGYVAEPHQVWQECARVLRPAGRLLTGMINPWVKLFADNTGDADQGLCVVHKLPFIEIETLSPSELAAARSRGMVFEWSHSLTDLIGGQIQAGFQLVEFAEAKRVDPQAPSINGFTNTYLMTAAQRA